MTSHDEDTVSNGHQDGEDKARWVVANMLAGSGLEIQALQHELVITNPDLPGRGKVHVDYDGGHVSLEHVAFDYWGTLEGFEPGEAGTVFRDKIIKTLTAADNSQ